MSSIEKKNTRRTTKKIFSMTFIQKRVRACGEREKTFRSFSIKKNFQKIFYRRKPLKIEKIFRRFAIKKTLQRVFYRGKILERLSKWLLWRRVFGMPSIEKRQ